jgi:DNA repair protein RecO (recombination protein O)
MPAPDRVYRTEAIVLRRHDLGETDRILTLYSRDYGKIRVVAKGVRKPSSRKAGHVELFVRADVLVARGRSLDVLTQVEMIDAFQPLRTDLVRATYAAHVVELLDAFTEDADENVALYGLLASGLRWISETGDLRRTARYYELHLLDLAGYRPELFQCVVCGEPIKPQNQFFSAADGGVVCPRCSHERPRARRLSLNALKVLRYMQTRPYRVVEQLKLGNAVQNECERLLHDALTYYLERRLKSAVFLERLRHEEAEALKRSPGSETPGSDAAG